MDRAIRITAYLSNIVLLGLSGLILANSYNSRDIAFGCIAILPALINVLALYLGPDLEERRLSRRLNKARMKEELRKLEQK